MISDPGKNQLIYTIPARGQGKQVDGVVFAFKVGNPYVTVDSGRHVWQVLVMSDSYLDVQGCANIEFTISNK